MSPQSQRNLSATDERGIMAGRSGVIQRNPESELAATRLETASEFVTIAVCADTSTDRTLPSAFAFLFRIVRQAGGRHGCELVQKGTTWATRFQPSATNAAQYSALMWEVE